MSTISELRAEAQTKGQELVKRYQELETIEKQVNAEKKQIEKQVDSINGEIAAYNKIEPPVTEVEPTPVPETVE
jgi:uncharacterized protein involved in exopolysaccharide biosynthesis